MKLMVAKLMMMVMKVKLMMMMVMKLRALSTLSFLKSPWKSLFSSNCSGSSLQIAMILIVITITTIITSS